MKRLWRRLIEWLFLRTMQTRYVEGTDPDDGGHGELRVAWNDPHGHNRPLFVVIMNHTRSKETARLIVSPKQASLFASYVLGGIREQKRKFEYTEAPDWDTRYIRVSDEE
jgi:hypothetical protein